MFTQHFKQAGRQVTTNILLKLQTKFLKHVNHKTYLRYRNYQLHISRTHKVKLDSKIMKIMILHN